MSEQAPSIGNRDVTRGGLLRRIFLCLALLSIGIGVVQAVVGDSAVWATTAPGIFAFIVFGLPQWLSRRIW